MKIGISIRVDWPEADALSIAQDAEAMGFDRIWTNGSVMGRDQLVFLSYAACLTKRIALGTAIIDPYSRHPVALAASAATLSSVTRREIMLGIGASHPWFFEEIGVDYVAPLQVCREAVVIIKKLLTGESVSFEGGRFTIKGARLRVMPKSALRVLVGAEGLKFIRMSGEVADGLVFPLGPPHYNEDAINTFFASVASFGRKRNETKVVALANISVADDAYQATELIRPQVAETISHLSPNSFRYLGISRETAESFRKDPSSMPETMVRDVAICGNVEDCITRIRKLERLGVSEIYLHNASLFSLFSPERLRLVRQNIDTVAQKLLPALRTEGLAEGPDRDL